MNLPRPFRLNAKVLSDIADIDTEYADAHVSAQIVVEINYKNGVPTVVKVREQRDYILPT